MLDIEGRFWDNAASSLFPVQGKKLISSWSYNSMRIQTKKGFTLTEVLVVIAIIGILASMAVPAVMAARLRALNTQCQNNLRNIGTAFAGYQSDKQKYPPSIFTSSKGEPVNWTYALYPYIDELARRDRIEAGTVFAADTGKIPLFVCPVDQTAINVAPLSYGMSMGKADAGPNTAEEGSGIGYNKTDLTNFFEVTPQDVVDGNSQTIMVAERSNPRKSLTGLTAPKWNHTTEALVGLIWYDETELGAATISSEQYIGFGQHANDNQASKKPTWGPTQIDYARPASLHNGTVNVLFCDGSVKGIRNDISYDIYAKLMTYDSTKVTSARASGVLSDY